MRFEDNLEITYLESKLYNDKELLCECKVAYSNRTWVISSWYTNKAWLHKGFGFITLQHVLQQLMKTQGQPDEIRYIWNQANQYVMDWLEAHFSPVSLVPIEIQKITQNEDSWDAHIYILDKQKVLDYFQIIPKKEVLYDTERIQ
jgi:hypothetical protein